MDDLIVSIPPQCLRQGLRFAFPLFWVVTNHRGIVLKRVISCLHFSHVIFFLGLMIGMNCLATTVDISGQKYTHCSKEGVRCVFAGTRVVRYGAGTKWVSRTETNGVDCTNRIFGDPIVGTFKSCELLTTVASAPPPALAFGYIDSLTVNGTSVVVNGWACVQGVSTSVNVQVYAGDKEIGSGLASQPSEPAVASVCKSTGSNYRYRISISSANAILYAGLPISVTEVKSKTKLVNSGRFTLPKINSVPQVCSPNSRQTCQAGNGTGTRTCDASGSMWSACGNITQCNTGYILQAGACAQKVETDTYVDSSVAALGKNIYAPHVVYHNGQYMMWYGGWTSGSDYPNDRIYLKTSRDGKNWSEPTEVLNPKQINPNGVHVNDPSVVIDKNQANGLYQFTMAYTYTASAHDQSRSEVWTSVSPDGINWYYHQPLLNSSLGSAEPSIITDPDNVAGTLWKVYYVDRMEPTQVKMVKVRGSRTALPSQTVFSRPAQVISSVDVKFFNNKWQLFFNVFQAGAAPSILAGIDLYKVVSNRNDSWASNTEVSVFQTLPSRDQNVCGTITPAILPLSGAVFEVFFGIVPRNGKAFCDLSVVPAIVRYQLRQQ